MNEADWQPVAEEIVEDSSVIYSATREGQRKAVEWLNLLSDQTGDVLKEHDENGVVGFLQAMEKGLDRIREAHGVEAPEVWSASATIAKLLPGFYAPRRSHGEPNVLAAVADIDRIDRIGRARPRLLRRSRNRRRH